MEIKSDVVKAETVELRDVDVLFGPGSGLSLTLESGDEITIPEPLCSGDIRLEYVSGEQGRINGRLVQLSNQRTRTVTRPVKAAAAVQLGQTTPLPERHCAMTSTVRKGLVALVLIGLGAAASVGLRAGESGTDLPHQYPGFLLPPSLLT